VTTSPVREDASVQAAKIARNATEALLFTLREIPLEFDREAVAARLQRALFCLYTTIDSDVMSPAHYEGLSEATTVLREARELLAPAGDPSAVPTLRRALLIVDNALRHASGAMDAVGQIQLEERMQLRRAPVEDPVPKPRPFRASMGTSQLHAIARPPLTPRVSVDPIVPLPEKNVAAPPPPVEKPKTLEALKAFGEATQSGALPAGIADEPPPPRATRSRTSRT
jgi:hypothetical protein